MWDAVERIAGAVLALGTIGVVFWFTFRNPPRRRRDDGPSSYGAEAWLGSHHDGGQPGPF